MADEIYCYKCGAKNPADASFCKSCGATLRQNAAPQAAAGPQKPVKRPAGITILGVFQILIALGYLALGVLITLGSVATIIQTASLNFGIAASVLGSVGFFVIFIGVIEFIIGAALLSGKNWSRILAEIGAIFDLFLFPIGTILGIILLIYLNERGVVDYFHRDRA